MKSFLFWGMVIAILSSCQPSKRHIDENVPLHELKAVVLEPDSLVLGYKIVAKSGDYVVMPTSRYSTLYELCKMQGDSLLLQKRFLTRGEGPDELGMSFDAYYADSQLLVAYDPNIRKALKINLHDCIEGKLSSWKVCSAFMKKDNISFGSFIFETDSTVIATCQQEHVKSYLVRLDLNTGDYDYLWGLWPDDGWQGEEYVKQGEYTQNASLCKRPGDNLYFISSGYGHYGEIFSVHGDKIESKCLVFDDYPVYSSKDGLNASHASSNYLGIDAFATRQFIYIKLREETLGDWRKAGFPSDWGYTDEVRVYGWDGMLRKKYHLDRPVLTMFVDEDDRTLWGMTQGEEEGCFVRYELH